MRRLSDGDAAYLAGHPARVHVAGEASTMEMIIGAAFLVGGILATYFWLSD